MWCKVVDVVIYLVKIIIREVAKISTQRSKNSLITIGGKYKIEDN